MPVGGGWVGDWQRDGEGGSFVHGEMRKDCDAEEYEGGVEDNVEERLFVRCVKLESGGELGHGRWGNVG